MPSILSCIQSLLCSELLPPRQCERIDALIGVHARLDKASDDIAADAVTRISAFMPGVNDTVEDAIRAVLGAANLDSRGDWDALARPHLSLLTQDLRIIIPDLADSWWTV